MDKKINIIDKLDKILTDFMDRLFWYVIIFAVIYLGGHIIWAWVR